MGRSRGSDAENITDFGEFSSRFPNGSGTQSASRILEEARPRKCAVEREFVEVAVDVVALLSLAAGGVVEEFEELLPVNAGTKRRLDR